MSGERSANRYTTKRAVSRSRRSRLPDRPQVVDIHEAAQFAERAHLGAPLGFGAAAIRFCPWCGAPLQNDEPPAVEARPDGGAGRPICMAAVRSEARRSAANDDTSAGRSGQGFWAAHTCESMPGARDLRTIAAESLLPSPESEDRTSQQQGETNDALIDRVIFGVFVLLGLLAMIRFILTH